MLIGTHNGSFHADEIFAIAMIRSFQDSQATWVRTRDAAVLAGCDVVVDVGGVYDVATRRFDHHQKSYTGERSSAGMVLDWLESDGSVSASLAAELRRTYIDHVDAVDTGRHQSDSYSPCVSSVVSTLASGARGEFEEVFEATVGFVQRVVSSVATALEETELATAAVASAMAAADASGSQVLWFDGYLSWKRAYFELGGAEHPTEFVAFPDGDRWKLVCIPPQPGSFANKRDLPADWAGLSDAELVSVTGIAGALFCHKNRFIAAFRTRDDVERALALAMA